MTVWIHELVVWTSLITAHIVRGEDVVRAVALVNKGMATSEAARVCYIPRSTPVGIFMSEFTFDHFSSRNNHSATTGLAPPTPLLP